MSPYLPQLTSRGSATPSLIFWEDSTKACMRSNLWSPLGPKDSSDEYEDEKEWTDEVTFQARLKETSISSPDALPENHPSPVQHK
eukprot:scaffold85414_cov51-Attheya_sp.AAC.1